MEQKNKLSQLLLQGDAALQECDWEKARAAYQQALREDSTNSRASHGLSQVDRREMTEQKIKALIEQGDARLAEEDFRGALDDYTDALNFAGEYRILKHHTPLEQKRNQARNLLEWQERVRATSLKARKCFEKQQWDTALQDLNALLRELPDAEPLYFSMAAQLREARDEAELRLGDEKKYQNAKKTFDAQDFEEVQRLAEQIKSGSPYYARAQDLLGVVRNYLQDINPALQRAEQAFDTQRWDDAFAELDSLREDYPQNPAWRKFWLQVGVAFGQQKLDEGRQANTSRNFEAAQQSFKEAASAFDKVFEVYETHAQAQRLKAEAKDLTNIASLEAQAQVDWQSGNRQEALGCLENARKQIEHARTEGREYSSVSSIVLSMMEALNKELEEIRADEQRLQEAELRLNEGELGRALQLFLGTLSARLREHRDRADAGRRKAEQAQRQFQVALDQARKSPAGSVETLDHLQRANALWPTNPDVLELLERELVNAGDRVLSEGDERQALDYFERALKINPQNMHALAGKAKPSKQAQVLQALEQVGKDLDLLIAAPETQASQLRDMAEHLKSLRKSVNPYSEADNPYPDLTTRIDIEVQVIQEWTERWQKYQTAAREAEKHWKAGRGQQAATVLQTAIQALGEKAPPQLHALLGSWNDAVSKVQRAQQALPELLSQARETYQDVTQLGALQPAQNLLQTANTLLESASGALMETGGIWPKDLEDWREEVRRLLKRVEVAKGAVVASPAREGLTRVREFVRLESTDSTLDALIAYLEKRMRDDIPGLLRQAEEAVVGEDFDSALDLLRQARELDPGDSEIQVSYTTLQRQQRLNKRLADAEFTAGQQKSGSPQDAVKTLREALQMFLSPDVDVTSEVRVALQKLLQLHVGQGENAFNKTEVWDAAQVEMGELAKHQRSWADRKAYELADNWTSLARDAALLGVVATIATLKNYAEGYDAASAFLKRHPTEEAIKQEADARERWVNHLYISAEKRLGRAEEAITKGNFDVAREHLESVAAIYEPAEAYENLLDGVEKVEQQRTRVQTLEQQVLDLMNLDAQVRPQLEAAEELFLNNKLDEVMAKMAGLDVSRLSESPVLAKRFQNLQERVTKASQDRVNQALADKLSEFEVRRDQIKTEDEKAALKGLQQELQEFNRGIAWDSIAAEAKARYHALKDALDAQLDMLASKEQYETEVDKAVQSGDYVYAVVVINKALTSKLSSVQQRSWELRLSELEPKAESQRKRAEAVLAAETALNIAEYKKSALHLRLAGQYGAPESELQKLWRAVEPGVLWEEAQYLWEKKQDWDEAQGVLDRALEVLKNLDMADAQVKVVQDKVLALKRRIERQRARSLEKSQHLSAARSALNRGDLEEARAALQRGKACVAPAEDEDLRALDELIGKHEQAARSYSEALKHRNEGKYESALATVQAALKVFPDYAPAMALKEELEQSREANKLLALARTLAEAQDFERARQELEKAVHSNADSESVSAVQKTIFEKESVWMATLTDPIKKDFREDKFPEALVLCAQALDKTTTPAYVEDLRAWQSKIVDRWVERSLRVWQQKKPWKSPADLSAAAADIDHLCELKPSPRQDLERGLHNLHREVHTEQLRQGLIEVEAHLQQAEWDRAEASTQEIKENAERYGLRNMRFDADKLLMRIREAREAAQEQRRQAELAERRKELQGQRDRLLKEALEVHVNKRADLERILDLASAAQKVEGYEGDEEIATLIMETQEQRKHYDETQKALIAAYEALRSSLSFDKCYSALVDLDSPSPLLQAPYDRVQGLVQMLIRADRDEDERRYEEALGGYRKALDLARGIEEARDTQRLALERSLERTITRCTEKVLDEIIEKTEAALNLQPPSIAEANVYLNQVQQQGLDVASYRDVIERLRVRITGQEHLNRAVALLTDEDADLATARAALQDARRVLLDSSTSEQVEQWEQFANALESWRRGELKQAAGYLENLPLPVSDDFPGISQLAQRVKAAQARVQKFDHANTVIGDALEAVPPQFDAAIKEVRNLRQHYAGADQEVERLSQRIQHDLKPALDLARSDSDYPEARRLGRLLVQLVPGDEEIKGCVENLSVEQGNKLEKALRDSEIALSEDRLADAAVALDKAGLIARPTGDSRIAKLQQQIGRRADELQQLESSLRDAADAVLREDWSVAVSMSETLLRQASNYQPVRAHVAVVQEQLVLQARRHLNADDFPEAIRLIDSALGLGKNPQLDALQLEMVRARDAKLGLLQKRVREALEVWDLDGARMALDLSKKTTTTDAEIERLQERCEKMTAVVGSIERQMESAWAEVAAREYTLAQEGFASILVEHPHFAEAQAWHDYVVSMNGAIQTLQVSDVETLVHAVSQFEAAEGHLLVEAGEQLSTVFGGATRLYEKRRQAAYDAYRLRIEVQTLVNLRAESLKQDSRARLSALKAIRVGLEQVLRLHNTPVTAPPEFSIVRGRGSIVKPVSSERSPVPKPSGYTETELPVRVTGFEPGAASYSEVETNVTAEDATAPRAAENVVPDGDNSSPDPGEEAPKPLPWSDFGSGFPTYEAEDTSS